MQSQIKASSEGEDVLVGCRHLGSPKHLFLSALRRLAVIIVLSIFNDPNRWSVYVDCIIHNFLINMAGDSIEYLLCANGR
jgi:hypothetical protein